MSDRKTHRAEQAEAAKKKSDLIKAGVLIAVLLVLVWFQFLRGGSEEAPEVAATPSTQTAPAPATTTPEEKDPSKMSAKEAARFQPIPKSFPGTAPEANAGTPPFGSLKPDIDQQPVQ